MTTPNGPAGLHPAVEYGIFGDPELGDTPNAWVGRTREVIEADLKARKVNGGNSVFTRPGGPFDLLQELMGREFAGRSMFEALAQRIGRALLDMPTHTWPTLADVFDGLGAIPTQLTEHTEAIANLNDIAAAMRTTQAYVGDLQDIVTVPRSQLVAFGQTGSPVDILTAQLIVLVTIYTNRAMPVVYPNRTIGSSVGDIIYTPLIVDRHGQIGKLRWIVGADTSLFSIDYYEMALCVYNPANGNVEKVWGSGDITSAEAAVTTLSEVEIDMGLTQDVTPGQILFGAHQQVAAGLMQSTRAFAAVPQAGVGRPAGTLLDAACYRAPSHSQGIPSSIALSALTRENRYIPWAAVTVEAP